MSEQEIIDLCVAKLKNGNEDLVLQYFMPCIIDRAKQIVFNETVAKQLFTLVRGRDYDGLKKALDNGMSPNAKDETGNFLLRFIVCTIGNNDPGKGEFIKLVLSYPETNI